MFEETESHRACVCYTHNVHNDFGEDRLQGSIMGEKKWGGGAVAATDEVGGGGANACQNIRAFWNVSVI